MFVDTVVFADDQFIIQDEKEDWQRTTLTIRTVGEAQYEIFHKVNRGLDCIPRNSFYYTDRGISCCQDMDNASKLKEIQEVYEVTSKLLRMNWV